MDGPEELCSPHASPTVGHMSFLTGEVGVKCREHWTTSWRRVSVWGEDIKKGLGVSPEDADLKKSQDRLQKLLPLGIEGGHAVRL